MAKKTAGPPPRWLPGDPPGQPARRVGRDLVVAGPDHRVNVKYPQAEWHEDASRWISDAANLKPSGEAGLSFILGVRIPDVPFVAQWRCQHLAAEIDDDQVFIQPWLARVATQASALVADGAVACGHSGRAGPSRSGAADCSSLS